LGRYKAVRDGFGSYGVGRRRGRVQISGTGTRNLWCTLPGFPTFPRQGGCLRHRPYSPRNIFRLTMALRPKISMASLTGTWAISPHWSIRMDRLPNNATVRSFPDVIKPRQPRPGANASSTEWLQGVWVKALITSSGIQQNISTTFHQHAPFGE
jgi:hypothetical protein